jgi:L-threonylcarbamoyladenylate synthase
VAHRSARLHLLKGSLLPAMPLRYFTLSTIHKAAALLREGALIAYPTEAVYGLGCDPHNASAVEMLFRLKQRSSDTGFLLIAADYDQVSRYIDESRVPVQMLQKVKASWPGATTWVLPPTREVPPWVVGAHEGIALRITAHEPAAELCRAFGGALVSTSANPHGKTPARSAQSVVDYFATSLHGVVAGPIGGSSSPTPIFDAVSGHTVRS